MHETDDRVTTTTEDGVPSIRLNISGRTVYAALKNLMVQHYGITPENVASKIMSSFDWRQVVTDWLNAKHVRDFIGTQIAGVVSGMKTDALRILREEAQKAIAGRVKITLGDPT